MTATLEVNGITYAYLSDGPAGGELVLLLHGFPDHAPSWRHQLTALAAAGYHAVAPYLRGYAPTGPAPDGCYMTAAIADDMVGLIDALGGGSAHVVGHDWGAVVAYGLAARFPDRVRSLTAMAVPHGTLAAGFVTDFAQQKRSWYMFFFQMQGIADMAVQANDFAFIDGLWRDWSPGYHLPEADRAALHATFAQPGVVEAALGYYRATFGTAHTRPDLAGAQAAMGGPVPVATTVVFGQDDGCISPMYLNGMEALFPAGLQTEVLPGAGHFVHLERPDRINELILERIRGAGV